MVRRIVFLDIDGVLNTTPSLAKAMDLIADHKKRYPNLPFNNFSPVMLNEDMLLIPLTDDYKDRLGMDMEVFSNGVLIKSILHDLVTILHDLDIKVVISSSWRKIAFSGLKQVFGRSGYNVLYDEDGGAWHTGSSSTGFRGKEIEDWLNEHGDADYLIIDDDSDFTEAQFNSRRVLRTFHDEGLTISDIERIRQHYKYRRKILPKER